MHTGVNRRDSVRKVLVFIHQHFLTRLLPAQPRGVWLLLRSPLNDLFLRRGQLIPDIVLNLVWRDLYQWLIHARQYSLGRHREHTLAALEHLKVGGRLVAVLPGDAPVLNWMTLDNYVYAKGKSFTDEFEDTGITVSVYVFKRAK